MLAIAKKAGSKKGTGFYAIFFASKWHSGSGEGSMISDRLIRKDSKQRPYIPGSTLKGVIRESCEKLSRTLNFPEPSDQHQRDLTIQDNFKPLKELESPVDRIFGNNYEGGNLFFRDARLSDEPPCDYCLLIAGIMNVNRLGGDKSTGSGEMSIEFDSVEYNGKRLEPESVFDFLDSDLYENKEIA